MPQKEVLNIFEGLGVVPFAPRRASRLRAKMTRRLFEPCRSLGEGGASFGASDRKRDAQG